MYTQTGYDASAHLSEETRGAALGAAKVVWRSVFWSGVGGWIVLLAITFAATDVDAVNEGAGSSLAVFSSSLTPAANKAVVLIATIGQLFCGMACVTSCSRMMYAFSRDRAVPGHRLWTRLNHHRVPAYAAFVTKETTARKSLKMQQEHDRRLKALKCIGLFNRLPEEMLETLADSLVPAPFAPGEILTRYGAEAHWLYMIVHGDASVRVPSPDGTEREIGRLTDGSFFGEMSLLTGEPRDAMTIRLAQGTYSTMTARNSGEPRLIVPPRLTYNLKGLFNTVVASAPGPAESPNEASVKPVITDGASASTASISTAAVAAGNS